MPTFARIAAPENLHDRVTRALGVRVLEAERAGQPLSFPNEAELCLELGVSRTILREAVKVLEDKGMIEVRPRSGTRARPRPEWKLLDPDVLAWQAELGPDARFLRDLCEVRLAIEPIASGFAALRASDAEIDTIEHLLGRMEQRGVSEAEHAEIDLQFHAAVVEASHNLLLEQLSNAIRQPFRTALSYTARLRASAELGYAAHKALYEGIRGRDPLRARAAAEEIVGLAMISVEQVIRSQERKP